MCHGKLYDNQLCSGDCESGLHKNCLHRLPFIGNQTYINWALLTLSELLRLLTDLCSSLEGCFWSAVSGADECLHFGLSRLELNQPGSSSLLSGIWLEIKSYLKKIKRRFFEFQVILFRWFKANHLKACWPDEPFFPFLSLSCQTPHQLKALTWTPRATWLQAVCVPYVETELQVNTMVPPAVMAARASSDAASGKTTCIHAGEWSSSTKKILLLFVWQWKSNGHLANAINSQLCATV